MKKNNNRLLVLVTLLLILCLYLLNSTLIIKSILNYTTIFINNLFPQTFIFYIISSLLIDYNIINALEKLIHKSSTKLYIIIMSMLTGFPSSPKYIKDLYNKNIIDLKTSNNYLMFSHFPNIFFILTTVKLIINDNCITIFILISILLSNILISSKYKSNKETTFLTSNPLFIKSLTRAINDSIKVIITIYGISIFFYLISVIIAKYFYINNSFYIVINGIFDLTNGIVSTKLLETTLKKALMILIFISFGSISIHMQIKSILLDTPIKYKYFLKGRIIGTILSIIIFLILVIIKNQLDILY